MRTCTSTGRCVNQHVIPSIFSLLLATTAAVSGQNYPVTYPPTTATPSPTPQPATARIRVVLNAPVSNGNKQPVNYLQPLAGPSNACNGPNCAPDQYTPAPQFQNAPPPPPVTASSCPSGNCAPLQQAPITVNAPTTSCTNGNCNNVVQAAPTIVSAPTYCSNGNCNSGLNTPIVVQAPSYSNGCYNGNCNNNAPIVIQAPSNSYSNGCYGGNCNNNAPIVIATSNGGYNNGCYGSSCGGYSQPIVIPSFSSGGCSGYGCGGYSSPIISSYPIISSILNSGYGCGSSGCGSSSTTNTFSSFGVPDLITANGNSFRPKVRVPIRYDNGNPVFTIRNGGGNSGFFNGFGRK